MNVKYEAFSTTGIVEDSLIPIKYNKAVEHFASSLVIAEEAAKAIINKYIYYGLVIYEDEMDQTKLDDFKDLNENQGNMPTKMANRRLDIYEELGHPNENSEIRFTTFGDKWIFAERQCVVGVRLLEWIMEKEANEKMEKEANMRKQEQQEKEEASRKKQEEKINEKIRLAEQKVDNGILRNVQVLSIFSGIISLLFANVIGISDFSNIGIRGLIAINFSMLVAITMLLVTVKIFILENNNYAQILKTLLIFGCFIVLLQLVVIGVFYLFGIKI